ncbi:unnamed protein product [Mytilus coruscus]|uniref:Integrase catalytic domain-containing protein n=1 Tax=Mytilus coruscus TaxID=42192 RepID=A0A6J8C0W9_MYTCO|nr:unnamed protein product [Mytilus coruscus]
MNTGLIKQGPKKCTSAQNSSINLGHNISNKGIEPPPDRVQAIVDYPIPKCVKDLRRLVGLFNWFRKYIKNFSAEMEPLTKLLKKYERLSWTDEQQSAFQKVKLLLLNSPILAFPNFNLPFRLAVDSCYEKDPFFPYESENTGQIIVPGGIQLTTLLRDSDTSDSKNLQLNNICLPAPVPKYTVVHKVPRNNVKLQAQNEYDADTEDIDQFYIHIAKKRKLRKTIQLYQRKKCNVVKESERLNKLTDCDSKHTQISISDQLKQFGNVHHQITQTTNSHKSDQIFDESTDSATSQCDATFYNQSTESFHSQDPDKIFNQRLQRMIYRIRTQYLTKVLTLMKRRKSVRSKTMNNFQLFVPEISLKTIIELQHDSTLGGHCGIQNTLDLIQEQYYFPNLSEKVTDYIRSCHEWQSRKNTTLKTKAAITSFSKPCAPFEVWEMDLQYGPVPVSRSGNSYIFTAIDLFSKYMYAEPIPITDPLTVGNALFKLVTQFGVCRTIISDQGSEFIGKCFREVCRLLDITSIQKYIPCFAHHCLGACERPHRTLSERLTPFLVNGNPWEDVLPGIVFSMNNTPNQSVGFSPFEIVYGKRPQFPLSTHIKDTDFSSEPKDCHTYLKQQCEKLNIIRTEVEKNSINSKVKMIDRVNKDNIQNISYHENDYVYLLKEPTGSGQKIRINLPAHM